MHPEKVKIAQDVFTLVNGGCQALRITNSDSELAELEATNYVLGLSADETADLIRKIIIALPDKIFYSGGPGIVEEIDGLIAEEFIYFQAQENWDDPEYPNLLINFISKLTGDIYQRFYTE